MTSRICAKFLKSLKSLRLGEKKKMTEKQIQKKLAGMDLAGVEIHKEEVEIGMVKTKKGEPSERLTRAKVHRIAQILGWGGYRCAHGGWVLAEDYKDPGDWNDKSSRYHY